MLLLLVRDQALGTIDLDQRLSALGSTIESSGIVDVVMLCPDLPSRTKTLVSPRYWVCWLLMWFPTEFSYENCPCTYCV